MLSEIIQNYCSCSSQVEQIHSRSLELALGKLIAFERNAGAEYTRLFTVCLLSKNDFLFKEGEQMHTMWFLKRGTARVYSNSLGGEVTNHFFFENEFVFFYDLFILQIPSPYTIQLMTDAELYQIDWVEMHKLIKKHSFLVDIEEIILGCNLFNYKVRIHQLQTLSATKRYQLLLAKRPAILNEVPLAYLASYLGISPERLSRIRRKLK